MNKKIFAVAAICAVMAFTGCSGSNEPAQTDAVTSAEAQTTAADTQADAAEDELKKAEEELKKAEEELKKAEEEIKKLEEAADASGRYEGDGYTIVVDENVWTDFSKYKELVGAIAEEQDLGFDVSAEDMDDVSGMFIYAADGSSNFNIISNYVGEMDFELSDLADMMEIQYSAIDGCTYLGDSVITVNGHECLAMDISMVAEMYEEEMKMSQYFFFVDGYQFVATYTAGIDSNDAAKEDFMKVLETIEFTV